MADIFENNFSELQSPLQYVELVPTSYTGSSYTFAQVPRAINCSIAGTLVVSLKNAVTASIYVNAGMSPYRVSTIHSGSSAGTIVGMY